MICKYCGNELDDNAELCFICGHKVDPVQQEPELVTDDPTAYLLDDAKDASKEQPDVSADAPSAGLTPTSSEVVINKPVKAGKFARFVSFLFALIGLIIYAVKKKNGEEAKANSIANAIGVGLCVKMTALGAFLVKLFMFS